MKIKTFVRRTSKTVLWACLFPWLWVLPFGVVACGSAVLGLGGAGWWWGWGVGLAVAAAAGTAGVIHNTFSKDKQPDSS